MCVCVCVCVCEVVCAKVSIMFEVVASFVRKQPYSSWHSPYFNNFNCSCLLAMSLKLSICHCLFAMSLSGVCHSLFTFCVSKVESLSLFFLRTLSLKSTLGAYTLPR